MSNLLAGKKQIHLVTCWKVWRWQIFKPLATKGNGLDEAKGWLVETLNSRHQYNHFCSSQTKTTSQIISLEKLSELSSFHYKSDLRYLTTNH